MATKSDVNSTEVENIKKMPETLLPNGFAKDEKNMSEVSSNSHENITKSEENVLNSKKVNSNEEKSKTAQTVPQRRLGRRSRSKSGTSDESDAGKNIDQSKSNITEMSDVPTASSVDSNDLIDNVKEEPIDIDSLEDNKDEASTKSQMEKKSRKHTDSSKKIKIEDGLEDTKSTIDKDSSETTDKDSSKEKDLDSTNTTVEDFKGFDDLSETARLCYKFLEVVDSYVKPDSYKSSKGEVENGSPSMFNPIVKLETIQPAKVTRPRKSKSPKGNKTGDPAFLKPFTYGWVRELVYRATPVMGSGLKRSADLYYYSPSNKKFRSAKEISEYLSDTDCKDLTIENFTFYKLPIGIDDPSKEIIRKSKGPRTSQGVGSDRDTPTPKKMPKGKTSVKTVVPPLEPVSPPSSTSTSTPRIAFKTNAASKKAQAKRASIKTAVKKRRSAGPDDASMSLDEGDWSPEVKPQAAAREVCSIDCRLAMGLIPTLQCVACLCLYHPECVSLPQAKNRQIHSYICKACQEDKTPKPPILPPPPPLTPINQQNPTKDKKDSKVLSSQQILGAVTTWLPPSSNVHLGGIVPAIATKTKLDACPQSLISVQGKKYILVPNSNHSMTVTGREEGSSCGKNSQSSVLLVPFSGTTTPTSHGTFVVQSSNQPSTYIVTSPPTSTPSIVPTNGVKRSATDSDGSPPQKVSKVSTPPKDKSPTPSVTVVSSSPSPPVPVAVPAKPLPPPNYWGVISSGYTALFHAFQYLKVHELLRAACVNRMWRHLASHRALWEHVRMKNTRVRDWSGFGRTLSERCTRTLDLRKMLVPETSEATLEMWNGVAKALADVPTLRRVDLGRCIPEAVEMVVKVCPQLEALVALTIRGPNLDANCLKDMKNLRELKLKSVGTFEITNLKELKNLSNLKHLAITTCKRLPGIEDVLPETLESLELGECSELAEVVATTALPKLVNLRRLRLEKGQGPSCPTIQILNAVAALPNLKQLELINFDVKPGFEKALAQCIHLRTLLIIPTYVTQSATTNHVVMGGVSKLANTLTYFIWGLTLELLRVTDLFIDQVEAQKTKSVKPKKGSGDSIPILKPLAEEPQDSSKAAGQTTSQVDILALPKLQKVLSTLLPTTKIKILKVPFSATWRQTVDP